MQRIALSSEGPTLDDQIEPRFGRAGGFIIIDVDSMEYEYLDNGASQRMAQGAGIHTAERIAEAGVDVVLTGFVGPKAFTALKSAGVKVCQDAHGTIREAIQLFKSGALSYADVPNKI